MELITDKPNAELSVYYYSNTRGGYEKCNKMSCLGDVLQRARTTSRYLY